MRSRRNLAFRILLLGPGRIRSVFVPFLGVLLIATVLGYLGQLVVGRFFLGEDFAEQFDGIVMPEQDSPFLEEAVGCPFVMLHFLGGGDQSGIDGRRGREFLVDLCSFLPQAVGRFAGFAFRLFADDSLDLRLFRCDPGSQSDAR